MQIPNQKRTWTAELLDLRQITMYVKPFCILRDETNIQKVSFIKAYINRLPHAHYIQGTVLNCESYKQSF